MSSYTARFVRQELIDDRAMREGRHPITDVEIRRLVELIVGNAARAFSRRELTIRDRGAATIFDWTDPMVGEHAYRDLRLNPDLRALDCDPRNPSIGFLGGAWSNSRPSSEGISWGRNFPVASAAFSATLTVS